MTKPSKTLYIASRGAWRAWLEKHHSTEEAIWLIYYKKHTGKPTIPYDDAVEEALCFGWIDSMVKRIDDEKHMQKYTPRRQKSIWSALNKKRALKMIRQGRMAEAGLEKIREAKKNGRWQKPALARDTPLVPDDLKKAMAANKKAEKNFNQLTPSQQKRFIWWITDAKKDETRKKRIKETVTLAAKGTKPRFM